MAVVTFNVPDALLARLQAAAAASAPPGQPAPSLKAFIIQQVTTLLVQYEAAQAHQAAANASSQAAAKAATDLAATPIT